MNREQYIAHRLLRRSVKTAELCPELSDTLRLTVAEILNDIEWENFAGLVRQGTPADEAVFIATADHVCQPFWASTTELTLAVVKVGECLKESCRHPLMALAPKEQK